MEPLMGPETATEGPLPAGLHEDRPPAAVSGLLEPSSEVGTTLFAASAMGAILWEDDARHHGAVG